MPLGSQATQNQQGKVPTDTIALKQRIKLTEKRLDNVLVDPSIKGKVKRLAKLQNAQEDSLNAARKGKKP